MSDTSTYPGPAVAAQRPATIMVSEETADGRRAGIGRQRLLTAVAACALALTTGTALRLTTHDAMTAVAEVETPPRMTPAPAQETPGTDDRLARMADVAQRDASDTQPPVETPTAGVDDRIERLAATVGAPTSPTDAGPAIPAAPPTEAGPAAPIATRFERQADGTETNSESYARESNMQRLATARTAPTTDAAPTEATASRPVASPPIADTRIAAVDVAINELTKPMARSMPPASMPTYEPAQPPKVEPAPSDAPPAQPTIAPNVTPTVAAPAPPAPERVAALPAETTAPSEGRRVRGRIVLEPSDGMTLYRLNPKASETPITQSITKYGDANVACESRNAEKSCFVSMITETTGIPLKMRIGAAQRIANPDDIEQSPTPIRRGATGLRYVMLLEGPPGVDPSNGFSVMARNAFGILPTNGRCGPDRCVAVADIDPVGMPIVGSADDSGITITATTAPRPGAEEMAIMWRYPTAGMRGAFVRVLQEMDGLTPEPQAPAATTKAQPRTSPRVPRRH